MDFDTIDRRLMAILQDDATTPIAELAERVGLSQTPCWKRVKRLTDEGVIERRVALLAREKLDLGLVV
ncbi:MAG: winged helix-turn-helix transcriptional regulator, partial [Caulobacter sp.]